MSLRLLSYNIRYSGAGREAPLAGVIRACMPDVVILQEATQPEIVKRIAAACAMPHYGARLGQSVAWMSRVEPSRADWHKPWMVKRAWLTLDLPGVRVIGVHLSAIHSNVTERRRVWEARALLATVPGDRFHLLTGDFNSIAPADTFELRFLPRRFRAIAWATGRIRWRTIALLLDAGYADVYRTLHSGPGLTFPTWEPHIRLDYCFVPQRDRTRVHSCEVVQSTEAREASDHFPLLTVVEEG